MAIGSNSFMKRMQEDIKRYNDHRNTIRVSLIERLTVKKIDPNELHPNPDDEFTFVNIGPSERIVEGYAQEARMRQMRNLPIFEEPILIQKMEFNNEYIILNGHHRWAAALKAKIPKVRVSIVNPGKR
ncbi:MAG: ParB N-terminal domain-containing protein [Eubacterium sp.]|nr:ParB N-terminal domain-containing protein [Eubacterium sp.]